MFECLEDGSAWCILSYVKRTLGCFQVYQLVLEEVVREKIPKLGSQLIANMIYWCGVPHLASNFKNIIIKS